MKTSVHSLCLKFSLDEALWDVRDKILAVNKKVFGWVYLDIMPESESRFIVLGNPYLLRTAFQLIEMRCKFSPDGRRDIVML